MDDNRYRDRVAATAGVAQAKCGGAVGQMVGGPGLNTAKPTGMLVGVASVLEQHAQHLEQLGSKLHRLADNVFGSNHTEGAEAGEKESPAQSHSDAISRLNYRIISARKVLEAALTRLEQLV